MSEIKLPLQKYKLFQTTTPKLFNNQGAPLKIVTEESAISAWQRKKEIELKKKNYPKSGSDIGILFEDQNILILRDLVKFPDEELKGYTRLLNIADLNDGQGSAILPIKEGKILLLHHYRHPTRQWHWEIPRGFGVPKLSAENNAKKEIKEEIGGEIEQLIDLGEYHNNTGIEGFSVKLFLAHISKTSHVQVEEGIDYYEVFSIYEVEKMIRSGEITDGFTIAAYTRANLRGLLQSSSPENEWKISEDALLPDILHIQPPIFLDHRGYLMEIFDINVFRKSNIPTHFILDHESNSSQGTLRGLHYQVKFPQGKLVRVSNGQIYAVAVDLRSNSKTFGKCTQIEISSENKKILWIPPGFAHGFYVLSKKATVAYKVTNIYAPEWERILAWDDPSLNIKWPLIEGRCPILSEKDTHGQFFNELEYFEIEK